MQAFVGILEGKNSLQELGVVGNSIKTALKQVGLIWLRTGSKGGALSLKNFGLHNTRGFPDKLRNFSLSRAISLRLIIEIIFF